MLIQGVVAGDVETGPSATNRVAKSTSARRRPTPPQPPGRREQHPRKASVGRRARHAAFVTAKGLTVRPPRCIP